MALTQDVSISCSHLSAERSFWAGLCRCPVTGLGTLLSCGVPGLGSPRLIVLQQRGCEGPAESPRLKVCRLPLSFPSWDASQEHKLPMAGKLLEPGIPAAAPVRQMGQELCQE